MPAKLRFLAPILLTAALSYQTAWAEGAYDSDWLIERWNGQWELAYKGQAGRVEKTAANQEVLRMKEGGLVLVLSMPAIGEGDSVLCGASERRDYRSACSSAFLDCRPSPDGVLVTLVSALLGYNMMDVRGRLECRINTNAVLRAAQSVGMILTILPVAEKEPQRDSDTWSASMSN